MNGVVNIDDLRKLAKKRLPKIAYDFIEGGTDDEVGLVTNEQAFRQARIVPRYLVDVTRARPVDDPVRPDLFEPDRHRADRPRRPVPPRRRPDAGRGGARRQRALHHVGLEHRLDRGSRQARARPWLVPALFRQGPVDLRGHDQARRRCRPARRWSSPSTCPRAPTASATRATAGAGRSSSPGRPSSRRCGIRPG